MNNKLNPLVIQQLHNSLNNSETIFNIINKQTTEDAKIIGAHNALSNYLDYEQLNDLEGMNEELVNLEQFLRSLTNFKPQYNDIEIVTKSSPIIHFVNGKIVEPSQLHQQLFSKKMKSEKTDLLDDSIESSLYFSRDSNGIYFTLIDAFKGNNPFTNTNDVNAFIKIKNNISQQVSTLKNALNTEGVLLNLKSKNRDILQSSKQHLSTELWIVESLNNDKINLQLTVYKEKEKAFLIIKDMERASLILALGAIFVIGVSLALTAKFIIDIPLKNIISFINEEVLKLSHLNTRLQSKGSDEIGVFSEGINNMLDKIQLRESELKNSEERLALALWGGDEGMWECDFENLYLDKGSSSIVKLGKELMNIPLESFFSMVHPDDINKIRESFKRYQTGELGALEADFRFYFKENEFIWLQLKGKLSHKNTKRRGLTGTLRDISEKVSTEQKNQLYAKAFNSSNNGIAILDTTFHILAINKAYSRITGYSKEEAAGTLATFIGQHEHAIKVKDVNQQIYKQGYWNGEIIGNRKNDKLYVRDVDLNPVYNKAQVLTHYVCVFSDITEKKKSEKALWKMANYDILTKLPNRAYFRKSIKTAIENAKIHGEELTALLFLDLDKFKQVNDTLGHEAGDQLLLKVASVLLKNTRKNDTVARLGGDEFAILLEGVNKKQHAENIAKKIIAEFNKGIYIQDTATNVGVSIGISFYPDDAEDTQSLVHCADTAMYSAKTTGSSLYNFYHSSMRDHLNRRNKLEQELLLAIQNDTLTLHYQPQYDTKTGKIVAFEALSRWIHPELGYISPEEFIAIAEDTGLIAELGSNVFNRATKQLKQWHGMGYSKLRMAINISPKQFMLTDVHLDISRSIKSSGIDAKSLELELTESLVIEEPDKIIKMLNMLKEVGIRLSIDDFGTGYSSLSYLSRFPLDALKIDKSFVQQTEQDQRVLSLTKAIIGIAHNLGLEAIAEGVETKGQLAILKSVGCEYIQGFYYSPAVSSDEAYKLLETCEALKTTLQN